MSEVKVNKISPRTNCGTVTLGDSGDTFTIPAGVSITNNGTASGFGATGSASWVTTKKTATFTATAGEGYFCDTNGGAFTVNLPSSPSAGAVVAVADYANTFDTANLTIGRGGSNIEGEASDFICNVEGAAITLVYVDATKGWITTDTGQSTDASDAKYVSATGGNSVTTCGNFKIHTFTGPGTFSVSCAGNSLGSNSVDYLVVAGGGGAGRDAGGGGGAGGFRLSNSTCMPAPQTSPLATPTALPVSVQGYPITVGGGGSADPGPSSSRPAANANGNPSIFSTITATAGGGAGSNCYTNGAPGGSGGGTSRNGTVIGDAGSGNTPPVSPPQGNPGGFNPSAVGGGGGGAAGTSAADCNGNGGSGSFVVQAGFAGCNGTPGPVSGARYFAGGGVGGHNPSAVPCATQTPGVGGGGGQTGGGAGGAAGAINTGGGGGAGDAAGPVGATGGGGGSGIVIIRYKYQ